LEILIDLPLRKIFTIEFHGLSIYIDKYSNLFWAEKGERLLPLNTMPWKYQQAFYLNFLHDYELSERFKDMEIIGAIDLFIKSKYCLGQDLELHY